MQKKFNTVAVGGTFDELHKGHRVLLFRAFELGERVQIGLCSDNFVRKLSKPHMTASYDQRLRELETFLQQNGLRKRAEIIRIDDPFGPTPFEQGLQALIVSNETEPNASLINRKRNQAGLPPLEIIAIDMIPSENHLPISTTRIRCGEIDREGRLL